MAYASQDLKLYYVAEGSYGVTPSPNPAMLGLKGVFDYEDSIDPGRIKLRGVGSRDWDSLRSGLKQPSMKFGYTVPSSSIIDFLGYADTLGSMSMETIYETSSVIAYLFKGMKINKLTVSLGDLLGDSPVVKASAELLGQSVTVNTAKNSTNYTDQTGSLMFNECYVKKSGVTNTRITDWSFTVENNLKQVPVIRTSSGDLIKYLQPRQRSLTGELTFEFESKDEHDEALAATEFWLEFYLGASHKVQISNCRWDYVKDSAKLEDLVVVKATFSGKAMAIS